MYRIDNKAAAIREIQTYLRTLAQKERAIPAVVVDGTYGAKTRAAVLAFQKIKGLAETGVVNYPTFTALYDAYLIAKEDSAESGLPHDDAFPLCHGDTGECVVLLHSLLRMLGEYYPDLGRVPQSSAFSSDTERAIRHLQKVFLYPESGSVNKKMYLRMMREIASCRAAERRFSPD